jgi:hypothetical protein
MFYSNPWQILSVSRTPSHQQRRKVGNKLEQYSQTIPQRQHHTKQQYLIFLRPANNIHHDIALHLEHHHPIIIQNNVAGLLCRFLQQPFFEGFLVFEEGVGVCAWCVAVAGGGGGVGWLVGGGVVFCEEAGGVVGGEDEDGVDGKEG